MRTTTHRRLLSVILLCASAACARAGAEGVEPRFAPGTRVGLVEVVNDGRDDVTLYVVRDGMRHRMGRVSRMETARFRLPDAGDLPSYRLSLVAEPLGSGQAFASAPVVWRPGQSVKARVGRNAGYHSLELTLR